MSARIAIVGAGPVGLEMALAARDQGYDVHVYEAGRVGEQLGWFGDTALFTPFSMNSTEETRERLRRAGAKLPADDAMLTARGLVDRCLAPMAALPEMRGRIHEQCRVTAISRAGAVKSGDTGAPRAESPFVLRVEEDGGVRFVEAGAVIDATGVVARPRSFGPGGLEARGERELGGRVDRHLPATREAALARYFEKQVLLIGSGHSAATALLEFDALARAGAGPARVHWVIRERRRAHAGGGTPFAARPDDALPARLDLERRANAIAGGAAWLERHPGCAIEEVESSREDGPIGVTLIDPSAHDARIRLRVDRVLSLVGYRPDTDLSRELQVHTCYASESPMALAKALVAARAADPMAAGDCLSQTTHGPETLRTTEPGFFVIGAKSYGRNPDFLLRLGYEQVRDVMSILAEIPSSLPSEAPA